MPIKLPDTDPKRELARKLFNATVSQIPYAGAPLVAIWSVTHRSEAERLIAEWRANVTNSINEIEKRIDRFVPTIKLSNDGAMLGLWLSKISEYGRSDGVDFDKIRSAFPDATKLELEDACGELQLERLITTSSAIGHKIIEIRLQTLLFEIFDPIAFDGANPRMDAAELASFALKHDETVSADDMLMHFGWNVRRLNPAMSILCKMVAVGRQSAEIHPEFECHSIMPSPSERAQFKRYISAVRGESD